MNIDAMIENWCRWHWTAMRWHRQRCASIESRWRSPQPWDSPPVTPLGAIDPIAAQQVEHAWQRLAHDEKLLLKWHYIFQRVPAQICRDLRRHGFQYRNEDYAEHFDRSKKNLENLLQRASVYGQSCLVAVVRASTPQQGRRRIPEENVSLA